MENKLMEVKGLKTYFETEEGTVKAVDGVSFSINKGETFGVVGESGCGKSVTALSIMQLVPRPRGNIVSGKINYFINGPDQEPIDITLLSPYSAEMRNIRGNEIAMIFQEPMTSLNPVYTVGDQIIEAIKLHQGYDKYQAREKAIEMLDHVGISAPEQRVDEYPFELSGGMRQRVMIAMALSCNPSLLIADEPTTALDVTIEAQILELIKKLKEKFNMAMMMITHDLNVVGEITDNVIVMYTGKVVEMASTQEIFYNHKHPYTTGLLNSIPRIGSREKLKPIKGSVPNLYCLPKGCYFAPRCPEAMNICFKQESPMFKTGERHMTKCWLYQGEEYDEG